VPAHRGPALDTATTGPQRDLFAAASALIVIDVQHDFCHADGVIGRYLEAATVDAMCASIDTLQAAAHRDGVPVVFVQTVHRAATDSRAWRNRFPTQELMVCREGAWGAEFHRCTPAEDDVVVVKHRYSAFHGTELQHVLHTLGRGTVVLTGTATNVCVESTARDACMLDYEVVVVNDATCAGTEAEHAAALFNIREYFGSVAGTAAVLSAWAEPATQPPADGGRRAAEPLRPGWQSQFHRERR
jgi:ureidoacrylate peracid hydrolase